MGTTFVQRPAKAMPFQQIDMHAFQYTHDADVHRIYFYIDLHKTCPKVWHDFYQYVYYAFPTLKHF